jgi:hypothetical protein
MVDGIENPYRADGLPQLFFGREALLAEFCAAVRSGRNAVRAVMGGRGMGKSSLARQIEIRLGADALTIITSGSVPTVASELGRALDVNLAAAHPVDALLAGIRKHPRPRVAIVLDEIEKIIRSADGDVFLDNLRKAHEGARGKLALIVLGGAAVRDLLQDEASPFLRIMGAPIHTLRGLERSEAAALIRAPLGLNIPDDIIDALWAETAGHPWLLQMFMEYAVEASTSLEEVEVHLPAAVVRAERRLQDVGFRPWWGNFRDRGQEIYRRVVRAGQAVPSAQWVSLLGNDPRPWLDVLASTGVVLLDEDMVLARGALFQRWVKQNHPEESPAPVDDALDDWLTALGVSAFERLVIRALAAWARATIEFPAAALKHDAHTKADNNGLNPEAFFQIHALVALLQHEHDLTAEPEALSMRPAGRSDIKVRARRDPTVRACVEFNIFGRKDDEVVKQVIGYAAPADTFAAVVSIDRCKRPLRPEFEAKCFAGAPYEQKHEPPTGILQPVFCTEHPRAGLGPLRIWHFLVQLRDT